MSEAGETIDRIRMVWSRVFADDDIRLGVQIGVGALAFLILVGVIYPAPVPILFLGVVVGSLSALLAMGIVLIYRANRIVNFAQGDLGALAAVLAASLIVGSHWGFWAASLAGLIAALGLGAFTEFVFIRRFAKAPRLILTVATIGIQEVFAAGQLALPKLFNFNLVPQPPVPFHFRLDWFPVTFNAGHLLVVVVVPFVVVGLAVFFRYTDIGIAVRAQAESADRAALLGVPTKRIGTLVWVIAAGLSGIAVLLRLPIQGVAIGAVLGPGLMLRALAAAVIGRMENLPVTFGAALGLGMIDQAVFFKTQNTIVSDAVMFFVILAALLFQRRRRLSRAEESGISSWAAVREVRPIPRELIRLPIVRGFVIAGTAAVGIFLLFVPLAMSSGTVNLFGVGLIFSMIILSLVVLTGWAGQISLGQLAFVAFGAAVAGTLAQHGWDFFLTLAIGSLAGAMVALAIGLPALRIRGLFLAVTTLAFAQATGLFFLNPEYFPWLVPKSSLEVVRPILFKKFNLQSSEYVFYYFTLLATVFVVGAVWSLRHSRTGRALVATRDNTRAAQAYGINRVRIELSAFALSGFIAAFAGSILVYQHGAIPSNVLDVPNNFRIFAMAVIGGLGSIPGALLGAAYQSVLEFSPITRVPDARLLASGAGLLFILLVLPSGLGGLLYNIRDRVLRRVARRYDIVVPSLLADVRVLEESEAGTPLTAVKHAGVREELPADALLTVSGLNVSYGKAQVLFGVDFYVAPAEIVALLGTNGAGKSTLLSAIAGLVQPTEGRITFEGADITKRGPNHTASQGIVLMPGSRGVFPSLTVEENLRLAAWLYKRDGAYVRNATEQVLGYFPALRERWRQRAGNLSGGEQQMLTLGQALIAKPKILMIDELSLGLAPIIVERLLEIVREIHANGTAVVLVEQSVNIAITLAERAVFLEKGEVRFEGRTRELLQRPDILRAVFLREGAKAGRRRRKSTTVDTSARPALSVTDLAVTFGGIHALDDVSLEIRAGQIIGIIGPNGAGKTTVFDCISGFVETSSGQVVLDDQNITRASPDMRSLLGLGRSFQDARLFPSMTVRQAIATSFDRHIAVREPVAAFVMSPAVRASERALGSEVDRLIELLHLEAFADKFVGELSTGTRRIVDIACSIAHDPKVLLLDEPSSGLAQRETEALGPVLLDLRERTGAALLIVEHDIPLITSISDELVALELGRVIATGPPAKVINDPAVIEGYLGSSEDVIKRSGTTTRRRKKPAQRKTARTRR